MGDTVLYANYFFSGPGLKIENYSGQSFERRFEEVNAHKLKIGKLTKNDGFESVEVVIKWSSFSVHCAGEHRLWLLLHDWKDT